MSATVIEALMVTLGLNIKGYEDGAQKVAKIRASMSKDEKAYWSEREKQERKDFLLFEKNNKEREQSIKSLRKEVFLLVAAFAGAVGIKNVFVNTIQEAANLAYLSENLGVSTERINAFQRASERMGGSAGGMTAQLKESVDTLAQLRS